MYGGRGGGLCTERDWEIFVRRDSCHDICHSPFVFRELFPVMNAQESDEGGGSGADGAGGTARSFLVNYSTLNRFQRKNNWKETDGNIKTVAAGT